MTPPDTADPEWDRLAAMTDDELLAEAIARGIDPVAQAERVRAMLLDASRRTRGARDRLMADPMPYRRLVMSPPCFEVELPLCEVCGEYLANHWRRRACVATDPKETR